MKKDIKMEEDCTLEKILSEFKENQYVLPKFQRDYEWGEEMVKELIKSVIKGDFINILTLYKVNIENKEIEYFGYNSLEFKNKDSKVDKEWSPLFIREPIEKQSFKVSKPIYGILDWQQRLTTLLNAFWNGTYYYKAKNKEGYSQKYIYLAVPFSFLEDNEDYREGDITELKFDSNWVCFSDSLEGIPDLSINKQNWIIKIPLNLLIKKELSKLARERKEEFSECTWWSEDKIKNVFSRLKEIEEFKIYRVIYEEYKDVSDLYEIFIKINTFWKKLTDLEIVNSLVDCAFDKNNNYFKLLDNFSNEDCDEHWGNSSLKDKDYISFFLRWIIWNKNNDEKKKEKLHAIFRRIVYGNIADIELISYLTDENYNNYYLNFLKKLVLLKTQNYDNLDFERLDWTLDAWFFNWNKLNASKSLLIENFESFFNCNKEKEFWEFYFKNAFNLFFNFTKFLTSNFCLLRAKYIDTVPLYMMFYFYSYFIYKKDLSFSPEFNDKYNNFHLFFKNILTDSHFLTTSSFTAASVRPFYSYFYREYNKESDKEKFILRFRLKDIDMKNQMITFNNVEEDSELNDVIKDFKLQNTNKLINSFYGKGRTSNYDLDDWDVDHIIPQAFCKDFSDLPEELWNWLGNKWTLEKKLNKKKSDKKLLKKLDNLTDFDKKTLPEDLYKELVNLLLDKNNSDDEKKNDIKKNISWTEKDILKDKIINFIKKREWLIKQFFIK